MKKGLIIIIVIFAFLPLTLGYLLAEREEAIVSRESQEELTQAHLGETAFLLRKKELLLGLRQTAYGIFDWFSLETVPLYDLFGSWNIFGKLGLFSIDPITIAARGGIFYVTLEQLPEAEQSSIYRAYLGGTLSAKVNELLRYHLNVNNTSLHGDIIFGNDMMHVKNLLNIESDLEYKFNDRRSVVGAAGYNISTKKVSLGGSHVWRWSTFHLKLGLTFRTGISKGLTMLPFFDLGIRF